MATEDRCVTERNVLYSQTDDKGVFATSLSKEFAIASSTFGLSKQQLWQLSYDSIDFIFADVSVKNQLRRTWSVLKQTCLVGS